MAAYAALVSLSNNLHLIHNHPKFSASFDKYQIQSLGTHIDFLLNFVEIYNIDGDLSKGAEELRSQIVGAAHEAEDIVESHIVNQILPQTSDTGLHHRCLFGLQKVIEVMGCIKDEVLKVKEERGSKYQKLQNSTPASSSTEEKKMVGFDEELMQLKDVLIDNGQQSSRQIISIVGMGGTGKTTLARNVYQDSLTMHHFDLRAWATISQDYDVRDILLQLLCVADGTLDELGERLHKLLFGRRYLIVLDDMWSMDVWDRIKFFFSDNGDGSRIVLTTRLSNVATELCSICININFLDEDTSWDLFCQKIFGIEDCPVELEGIGKKIVRQCKGLPLSIVVIGGVLRKSSRTEEHWRSVAENINAIFNSRENWQCLDVLYLSYSHLPAHLKPCFLYMGTFKEDSEIRVSEIIKLWVAEGFLKPNGEQILEEMAEDYLKDLIDRNLILVCAHSSNGKVRSFRIHDLLRELCLRVADKEEFFCIAKADREARGIERERRLIFHYQISSYLSNEVFKAFQSASLARSLICDFDVFKAFQSASLARSRICDFAEVSVKCRLLRVLNKACYWSPKAEFQNMNLRHVVCPFSAPTLPSSISLMWNLQTLVVVGGHQVTVAPPEIWKMTQLRHLKFDQMLLPDPPRSNDKDEFVVLGNLQTLQTVMDFRMSEEACKRIPNVKKLRMIYGEMWPRNNNSLSENLQNLGRLQGLESLYVVCYHEICISKLKYTLPTSLKKLVLRGEFPCFEDFSTIIGSLPQLEVLKVSVLPCSQRKLSFVEGGFLRLKFLSICHEFLGSWIVERACCFPVLEKLVLINLHKLNEIPSSIGEISTLQLISLENCIESIVISAMKIKQQHENFGNYGLQIQVKNPIGHRGCFCLANDPSPLIERPKGEG